jgi:hypothetical protein
MGQFLLRLINRDSVLQFSQAAEAYWWLDTQGTIGELYELAWTDELTGEVTEIERDALSPPSSRQPGRDRRSPTRSATPKGRGRIRAATANPRPYPPSAPSDEATVARQ